MQVVVGSSPLLPFGMLQGSRDWGKGGRLDAYACFCGNRHLRACLGRA
ncbi:MAG: hypothetical protein HGB17_16615 [Syntrophobacteraceae bacterium]|nr:hypothetical protein [Syntrophobacteraceae bacterium]